MTSANLRMHQPEASVARPAVIFTPDLVDTGRGKTEREYSVRANYADAIIEAGGSALIIPLDERQLKAVLELADGVVISGSGPGECVAPERIAFERNLIEYALKAGKPMLGICHGMQVIGEHLGGRIVRDLPQLSGEITPHIPRTVPDRLAHHIDVAPDSLISEWSDGTRVRVNSLHRHTLTGQGRFRIAARADDGIIEAIEGIEGAFCLGVQWHPEYQLTDLDRNIMRAFVAACRKSAAQRAGARMIEAPAVRSTGEC